MMNSRGAPLNKSFVTMYRCIPLKSLIASPLTVPFLIFLLSGLVGYWSSYDPAVSLPKLLMLVAAVVLYFAIVALRFNTRLSSMAVGTYILGGAAAALYFIAQTNFAATPSKFEILTRLGEVLNTLLPRLNNHSPHPNLAAGALEIVLP